MLKRPSIAALVLIALTTCAFGLDDFTSSASTLSRLLSRIQRNVSEIVGLRSSIPKVESRLKQLESDETSLRRNRAIEIDELQRGLYCSQCSRTKTRIYREERETFEQHLRRVKGDPVPAPPELQLRKRQEFESKIGPIRRELDSTRSRLAKLKSDRDQAEQQLGSDTAEFRRVDSDEKSRWEQYEADLTIEGISQDDAVKTLQESSEEHESEEDFHRERLAELRQGNEPVFEAESNLRKARIATLRTATDLNRAKLAQLKTRQRQESEPDDFFHRKATESNDLQRALSRLNRSAGLSALPDSNAHPAAERGTTSSTGDQTDTDTSRQPRSQSVPALTSRLAGSRDSVGDDDDFTDESNRSTASLVQDLVEETATSAYQDALHGNRVNGARAVTKSIASAVRSRLEAAFRRRSRDEMIDTSDTSDELDYDNEADADRMVRRLGRINATNREWRREFDDLVENTIFGRWFDENFGEFLNDSKGSNDEDQDVQP